ncbi:SICAvar, type I (fragment) [Plasmodium knowlesi strain H]|uniref:SICAvar, type I n=2 Tax=Plasmodium knowlesi (strain H) TaxID=5851 RepID=A0A1A7VQ18_PLAKH
MNPKGVSFEGKLQEILQKAQSCSSVSGSVSKSGKGSTQECLQKELDTALEKEKKRKEKEKRRKEKEKRRKEKEKRRKEKKKEKRKKKRRKEKEKEKKREGKGKGKEKEKEKKKKRKEKEEERKRKDKSKDILQLLKENRAGDIHNRMNPKGGSPEGKLKQVLQKAQSYGTNNSDMKDCVQQKLETVKGK